MLYYNLWKKKWYGILKMESASQFIAAHPTFTFVRVHPGDKKPKSAKWQETVGGATNREEVLQWVAKRGNYGILLGPKSGVTVVDYDLYKEGWVYDADAHQLVHPNGGEAVPLEDTLTVLSGSGGIHSYFAMPQCLSTTTKLLGHDSVDYLNDRCFVVGPGSTTAKGTYRVVRDAPLADMPQTLVEIFVERTAAGKERGPGRISRHLAVEAVEGTPDAGACAHIQELLERAGVQGLRVTREVALGVWGCQSMGPRTCVFDNATHDRNGGYVCTDMNHLWFKCHSASCVGQMLDLGPIPWGESVMETVLPWSEGARTPDAPLFEWELALIYGGEDPAAVSAKTLSGGRLLSTFTGWYLFNGVWRREDESRGVYELVQSLLAERFHQLKTVLDHCKRAFPDRADAITRLASALLQRCNDLGSQVHIDRLMKRCRARFYSSRRFDENPALLGFEDGVYDLDALAFRSTTPEDSIAMSTGWHWDDISNAPKTDVDRVHAFVSSVFEEPQERDYMLRNLRCFLHGAKNRKFDIWTGSGCNGKTLLVECLARAMGDYAFQNTSSWFITPARDADPYGVKLHGKRMVYFEEPPANSQLCIDKIKMVSGGTKLTARGLYKEPQDVNLQVHLIMVCNLQPDIQFDGGFERRVVYVPFNLRFLPPHMFDATRPDHRRGDDDLAAWMRTPDAAKALLALLLLGSRDPIPDSLPLPPSLQAAADEQTEMADPTAMFVQECIVRHDAHSIQSSALYDAYTKWCYEHRAYGVGQERFPLSQTAFSADAKRALSLRPVKSHGKMVWRGVAFTWQVQRPAEVLP
jgi:P4 family phage/plasmid primase-like protien